MKEQEYQQRVKKKHGKFSKLNWKAEQCAHINDKGSLMACFSPFTFWYELHTLQWIFRVQLNRERKRTRCVRGKNCREKKMSMDDYVAWFGHLSKLHSTDCEWKIMSRFYFIIFCLSIEKLIQSFHILYFLGPQCLHIHIYTAVYWINW